MSRFVNLHNAKVSVSLTTGVLTSGKDVRNARTLQREVQSLNHLPPTPQKRISLLSSSAQGKPSESVLTNGKNLLSLLVKYEGSGAHIFDKSALVFSVNLFTKQFLKNIYMTRRHFDRFIINDSEGDGR